MYGDAILDLQLDNAVDDKIKHLIGVLHVHHSRQMHTFWFVLTTSNQKGGSREALCNQVTQLI